MNKKVIKIKTTLPETKENVEFFVLANKNIDSIPKEQIEEEMKEMLKEVRVDKSIEMKATVISYSHIDKSITIDYGNTLAEVNLPYCLHMPNGCEMIVKFTDQEFEAKVLFEKIWTEKSKGSSNADFYEENKLTYYNKSTILTPKIPKDMLYGWELNFTGQNAEKVKDNFGYFRYTKLIIFFNTNYKKEDIENGKSESIIKEVQEKVSNVVNRILDVYRYITREEHVERLGSINMFNVYFYKHHIGFYPLDMKIRGAMMNRPRKEIREIKKMLIDDKKPPIHNLLYLSAKSAFHKKMFTLSLVTSFQSLEIFLENFLIKKYKSLGISEKDMDDKLNKVWRTKERLKDLLKETTGHALSEEKAIWDPWCTIYDKVRNDVIHGSKEPTVKEAKGTLILNLKIIKWIKKLP